MSAGQNEGGLDRTAVVVLTFGVLAVSTAATLIRLADAPATAVAAYRLVFASMVAVPLALPSFRRERARPCARDCRRLLLSGGFLAAHFALWIGSLSLTSVASSVVLVTTSPIWVGFAAPFVLREPVPRRLLTGILVAFAGATVVAGGDLAMDRSAFFGDLMALAGAGAAAAYFLIGREVRPRIGLLPYIAIVYATAAAALLALAAASRTPLTGFDERTWLALVLLGLVPQILGHSSFNWALRRLSATFVAGTVLGEAVGSTLLAWWVLAEVPPTSTLLGGAVVLAGLSLAASAESSPAPAV